MKATTSSLATVCNSLGLSIQSTSGLFQVDDEGWEHIAFQSQISRNGKQIWNGPFKLGIGHVKLPKREVGIFHNFTAEEVSLHDTLVARPNATVKPEYVSIKASLYQKMASKQKLTPQLDGVIHSLVSDGAAFFDAESFEDWCSNFGYDTDSRKAFETYNECVEAGRKLRQAFKAEEIEQLREAAQDF